MSTFYRYLDEVPISGYIGNGTWNVFDLAPYLVGTNIQAVTLRVYKVGNGNVQIGWRAVGSTEEDFTYVVNTRWCAQIVALNGGTEIELYSSSTAPVFNVTGELRRNCVCHPERIWLETPAGQSNTWVTRTPTLNPGDELKDVRAVVLCGSTRFGFNAMMGARRVGSSDQPVAVDSIGGHFFTVVEVDENGFYETYADEIGGVVRGFHFESAYLKADSNVYSVMDHVDLKLPGTSNAWMTANLSGSIPDEAINVGIRIVNTSVARVGFVRTVGSSETIGRPLSSNSMGVHFAMPNANVEIEYSSFDAKMDFYVDWYELPAKTAVVGKTFVGPATRAEGFTGPATVAGAGLGAGTAAGAGLGPAGTGTATFNDAGRGAASIGVR